MEFKVIREIYRNHNFCESNYVCNTYKLDGSFLEKSQCHVHLLCMNYRDHYDSAYIADLGDGEYNDFSNLIIYKKPKQYNDCCGHWGVIASSDSSLDLPSIDQSIADLVKDISYFDFEAEACYLCHNECYQRHIFDGINQQDNELNKKTSKYLHRPACSWFDRVLPYNKAFKEVRFFWENDGLFVLRKYNNKIYEGYQHLNLTDKEKESMLNR